MKQFELRIGYKTYIVTCQDRAFALRVANALKLVHPNEYGFVLIELPHDSAYDTQTRQDAVSFREISRVA